MMLLTRKTLELLSLASACAMSACYTYSRTRPGISYENQPVQLSLTDSGSVVLASQIGPSMVAVEGNLLADSSGTYVVSVQNTQRRDGSVVDWTGERVTIPHVLVSSLGARQFSAPRTLFFGALTAAAIVAVTAAFGGLGSVLGSGHTGGSPGSK